jgi:hypothetical protein
VSVVAEKRTRQRLPFEDGLIINEVKAAMAKNLGIERDRSVRTAKRSQLETHEVTDPVSIAERMSWTTELLRRLQRASPIKRPSHGLRRDESKPLLKLLCGLANLVELPDERERDEEISRGCRAEVDCAWDHDLLCRAK